MYVLYYALERFKKTLFRFNVSLFFSLSHIDLLFGFIEEMVNRKHKQMLFQKKIKKKTKCVHLEERKFFWGMEDRKSAKRKIVYG